MENSELEELPLERKKKRHFWRGSKSPELEQTSMTEYELVSQAIVDSGLSVDEFLREALIAKAKRSISIRKSSLKGQGRAGSSDERLRNAIDLLERAGNLKGATQVMEVANTNYYTTLAYLNKHRPDLLTDKQLHTLSQHKQTSRNTEKKPDAKRRLAIALRDNPDISPSALAKEAKTSYPATLSWLAETKPEKLSPSQLKKAKV